MRSRILFSKLLRMILDFSDKTLVELEDEVKFIQLFKNAFFIMLVNPAANIMMLIGFVAAIFVMKFIPALLFIFGGSISAGIIMASCYLAFQKIEKKKGQEAA